MMSESRFQGFALAIARYARRGFITETQFIEVKFMEEAGQKVACNKISYPTKAAAITDAKLIRASTNHFRNQSGHRKSNMKLRAYDCPLCESWHLTVLKQKPKYNRRKRRKS